MVDVVVMLLFVSKNEERPLAKVCYKTHSYRFESCPDYAETQHNDVVAVAIRRVTLS